MIYQIRQQDLGQITNQITFHLNKNSTHMFFANIRKHILVNLIN